MRSKKTVSTSALIVTLSTSLLLTIVGLGSLIGLATHNVATQMRQNAGFTIVLTDSPELVSAVDSLRNTLAHHSAIAKLTHRDAATVLARWEEMMGPEELLDGANPFLPETEVYVHPEYAHPDSLSALAGIIEQCPAVDHVQLNNDIAADVDAGLQAALWTLSILGLLLLLITITLLASNVRLEIYTHRLLINTMQYVGATKRHIIWPYVRRSMLTGAIGALLAYGAIELIYHFGGAAAHVLASMITETDIAIMGAALFVLGTVVSAITAALAALTYTCRNYDQTF